MSKFKPRLLIFIVAYNAEKTISWVLKRIPISINKQFVIEVLIIDDQSTDNTANVSQSFSSSTNFKFPIKILYNPVNQGYGGNQKIGYHYAIKNKFDFVALLHGDGQYAPEELPNLIEPLIKSNVDAVFGSRMIKKGEALRGGMPIYKFLGNKILTKFENLMLNSSLSEFHSGYRIYSVKALKKIPFQLNTSDFHFDTQIIIQFLFSNFTIKEIPIPTYYGDEICHVNGIKYAFQVFFSVMNAYFHKLNLLYDHKYDLIKKNENYEPKFNFYSTHKLALEKVGHGSRVLDIGCAGGYVGRELKTKKNAFVFGLDLLPLNKNVTLDGFMKYNLENGIPSKIEAKFDYILLLDVIEHLSNPEKFLKNLKDHFRFYPDTVILVSTGNVAFFVNRIFHFFGVFNYTKKGILDITHKRLFTKKSFIKLFNENGFVVNKCNPIPGPWSLLIGENLFAKFLTNINNILCRLFPGLFAYQFMLEVKAKPHLDYLLLKTIKI